MYLPGFRRYPTLILYVVIIRFPKHPYINCTSFDSQLYQTHQCQNTHSLYHIMHFVFPMHSSLTHIHHLLHKLSNNSLAYTFITTTRYSNSQRHKPHSIITQLDHYTYFQVYHFSIHFHYHA